MTKQELVIALIKVRMTRLFESQGHSPQEAKALTDDAIRNGGIIGMKALATPEGSIVTIVESYLQFVAKRCVELGGAEHFSQANEEALAAIEAHRSRFGAKGSNNYPKSIDDYVSYRVNLEIQSQLGCTASEMGLDEKTIKMLTHTAKSALRSMMTNNPKLQGGSKSCFIATACFGSPDVSTVLVFRQYREIVLKRSLIGRHIVYWYYKISPPIARYLDTHYYARMVASTLLARFARRLFSRHLL